MISEHEEEYQDLMNEDTNVVTIELEKWKKRKEEKWILSWLKEKKIFY